MDIRQLPKTPMEQIRGLLGDYTQMIPVLGQVDALTQAGRAAYGGDYAKAAEQVAGVLPVSRWVGRGVKAISKGKGASELGGVLNANNVRELEQELAAKGVNASLGERNGVITLNKIIVPKDQRNTGLGTAAMQDITKYADQTNQRLALTPSSDFGGSKARLGEFYKRFGFSDNKGKSKDYSVSESMLREPQALGIQAGSGAEGPDSRALTQYERNMEIASRNAALPVEQGGLGLPENNTPMDRARAMGFDVDNPLYHSTNADIERFEPSRKGKFGTGIYTSPDVSMSEKYLPSGEGQNVMPLFQRGEALDSRGNDQGQLARLGVKQGQDLEDWMYPRSERKKGADPFAKLNKASAEAGFTSVNYPSPWYENVVVDPKALRSRFAAFDPMRRNEADLLAFNSGGRGLLDVPNFERLYGLIGQ